MEDDKKKEKSFLELMRREELWKQAQTTEFHPDETTRILQNWWNQGKKNMKASSIK